MKSKTLLKVKSEIDDEDSLIESHPTTFLDMDFYEKFTDEVNGKIRPVVIKAIDAGWIFKEDEGREFLLKLSESDQMEYFSSPTIRTLIRF